jgi:integrase
VKDRAANRRPSRPFDAAYRAWLDTYARTHCKIGTWKGYEAAGRLYLIPHFGTRDLRAITREDVKRLVYERLMPGRAPATVRANLAPLREMLNHFVEDGVLATNPAARVLKRGRDTSTGVRRPPRFLTREELARLVETCRATAPRWHLFVLTLARTGMRLGEVCALQWRDVDLDRRIAIVQRAFWRGQVQTPKNGRVRHVDLSRQLSAALRAAFDAEQNHASAERRSLNPWIFARRDGRSPNTDNFRRRVWRRLFRDAGLPYAWPHSLRHTYASLLLQNGESLAYVKAQLGHRSIQMTVDVYGHLVAGENRAAVDRLDDAVTSRARAERRRRDLGDDRTLVR